jgi:type I restriction enzyme S subunit
MSKLTRHKFGKLYQMSSGISSKPDQAGHGAPFLSFSTVFNNYFLPAELENRMDTSEKEQKIYSIKEGDIFLTRTSEVIDELGMSSVALKNYPKATYSGFLKRLRPTQGNITEKITYPKFMAFYLRSPLFRKTMTNNAVLTLRASLNEEIFSYLDLLLTKYEDQVKAGDFLYLLSQKIELNNRINAELEAMAKTLYYYWFVQFDFPDQNGKPYKSSGGKMVYNETLKREIPAGWKYGPLSNWIACDKTGDWGKDSEEGNYTLQVNCVRGTDINGINGAGVIAAPTRFILEKNGHKILSPFDFVIEISGGSPTQSTGRMAFFLPETLDRFMRPAVCSNFCKAISLKDNIYFFNFAYEWSAIYDNGILFGWEGKTSGIKNLLFDAFVSKHSVCRPPQELAQKFFDFVSPLQIKKQKQLKENDELVNLRDWLLPMLMNGQVTVA